MAERTQFQVDPILHDGKADSHPSSSIAMEPQAFANAIRAIKLARGGADQMKRVGKMECTRLEVIPASRLAVAGLPEGSSQFDLQSIFTWMRRVQPGDTVAIEQIRALTATAATVDTRYQQ